MRIYLPTLLIFLALATRAQAQTDTTIGTEVTSIYGGNYTELANAICQGVNTERGKANALYNWVTHNIAYDVKGIWEFGDKEDRAGKALKARKAICSGYSMLYVQLCKGAGLDATTVDGYAKDQFFDNGDALYLPRHEWSAVRINGAWELVDATWGAGGLYLSRAWWQKLATMVGLHPKLRARNMKFKYHYDPQYFAQDPEIFRLRHIPLDPVWQLTDTALPLANFEAGDSAVYAFNAISKPAKAAQRLDELAILSSSAQQLEMADRAYAYNPRCHIVKAYQQLVLADTALHSMVEDMPHKTTDSIIRSATANVKGALDNVRKQKKTFPEAYSKLGKKNKAKSADAKKYVQAIKTDDKRLIAATKRHRKSAESKYARARKKAGDVQKKKNGLATGHLNDIETSKAGKKEGSPELQAIDDSIAARDLRLAILNADLSKLRNSLDSAVDASSAMLDTLALAMRAEDSMLRQEALERLNMHDSYDDEVRTWSTLFKKQKYTISDTLMKYYFATFDSIAVRNSTLQKMHGNALTMYKNNVKALEQYKKKNDGGSELRNRYNEAVKTYADAIEEATNSYTTYLQHLESSQKVFAAIASAGKRQLKVVAYMERAEKSRQDLEARTIAHKKSLDIKSNEHQRTTIQTTLRKLEKARAAI